MLRALVAFALVAVLGALGYRILTKRHGVQPAVPVVAGEPLPDLTKFDTDQGATWKYVPILMNRARIAANNPRHPQAASCPELAKSRDANAWLRWRRKAADQWNEENFMDRAVYDEIMACRAELEALGLWNCFSNVRDFAFQATLSINNRLGFEVPDTDYYGKILAYDNEALALPKPLDNGIPQKISAFQGLSGDTPVKSYAGVAKINTLPNWKVVKYSSRTVNNPNAFNRVRSYNRLLFMNTGPRYDKFIQFTLSPATVEDPFGANGLPQQLMDFISVEKVDKDGNVLAKPKLRFAQFNRDQNGRNPTPRLNYQTGEGSADTCYVCHPGGLRYLSPLPGSVTPVQYKAFQTINDRIAALKAFDWDGAIHPEYYGPPRGATVGCMDCHNNGHEGHVPELRRGPINHATYALHISHKLRIDYSMTQARLKGHLAVINYVKGIDRFTSRSTDVNNKLDQVRNDLLRTWLNDPSSLVFDVAFQGAKKIAAVADRARLPYLPEKLRPNEDLGETMDKFLEATAEDQGNIERVLFQQGDTRYKIETANWMEMRCPDTPIEAHE